MYRRTTVYKNNAKRYQHIHIWQAIVLFLA